MALTRPGRVKALFARPGFALIALTVLTSPAFAQSPAHGDPCAALAGPPASPPSIPPRVRMEQDTAIVIAKHVQRVCRLIWRACPRRGDRRRKARRGG
jgi:hypothetical protein